MLHGHQGQWVVLEEGEGIVGRFFDPNKGGGGMNEPSHLRRSSYNHLTRSMKTSSINIPDLLGVLSILFNYH
jgi:hypothetical protein